MAQANLTINLGLDTSEATFALIDALEIMAHSAVPIQPNDISDVLNRWRQDFDKGMELNDGS